MRFKIKTDTHYIAITDAPLDLCEAYRSLQCDEAGAVDLFVGTVRNEHHGSAVLKLHFEAYQEMALKMMFRLAESARKRYGLHRVLMLHRLGEVQLGETAVIIGVSSSHRGASFDACRWLIDTLKQEVPIWKQEYFADGRVVWDEPGTAQSPGVAPYSEELLAGVSS